MKRTDIKRRPMADTVLASLEPEAKVYREHDGQGLYLRVKPNGNKVWDFRYKRPNGKWSWKGLGSFPRVSGKAARQQAGELRRIAAEGVDIGALDDAGELPTFAEAAEQWYQRKIEIGRSPATLSQMRRYLDKDVLPRIGKKPLAEVSRADCAGIQAVIERRSAHNIAEKVRAWVSQIFSEAIAKGMCDLNPASELRHIAAKAPDVKQYPHLLEPELPDFLSALRSSRSRPVTLAAIWLLLRTASRPGMVRFAEWREVSFEDALWSVPADKMKMRRDHLIPLPRQTIESLSDLRQQTGRQRYLFPGQGDKSPCMSDATINKALTAIGYKGKLVGHGARHTASTLLREHGWHKDYVEAQLAHKEAGVAGIYNQAQYLDQRREMMQWYADYLDGF